MATYLHPQPPDVAISPIHRLPPELLIDILVHCSDQPSDQLTPVVFGRVCRYWNDISCLSPRIWQHIYLFESNGTVLSHEQAIYWMKRSNPLPFDVRIEASTTDMILPLLSPIMSNMQRLRRCVISARHQDEFDFDKYAFDRTRECLVDGLDLFLKGVSALDVLGLNTDSISNLADDRTHSSIFRVHSPPDGPPELALRLSVYALPLQSVMRPIPVKSLSITEASLDVITDVVRIFNFLRCTPMLEALYFTGYTQEGEQIQPGQLSPVTLGYLRTLRLRSTVSVRAILEHVDAPALEELYLEHTNVDVELRTEPYVAQRSQPDEGESDDEAYDFSQSPWSDHCTGMGLRTFLRRSRPRLHVLVMDYADMRTKDFRWCFDNLPHLREFCIVGSDMSDRVIGMLSPYQKRRRMAFGLANINPRDAEDPKESWTVRMPSLTKLAVRHCQRVTGDAVVQALRERIIFTDRMAGEGRGDTLESVSIFGCSEFLFQHGQALADMLGERMRLS